MKCQTCTHAVQGFQTDIRIGQTEAGKIFFLYLGVKKQAYNAEMLICSHSSEISSMGKCSYIHFIKALKSIF